MTREDIIALAREAGGSVMQPYDYGAKPDRMILTYEVLERFAALVAAAEREACAKVCEAQRDARIETRPARVEFSDNAMSLRCAAAIRKRGER